jgi:hypothetical protein
VIVHLPECLQQASQSVASFHPGVKIEVELWKSCKLLHVQALPGDINATEADRAYRTIVFIPVALV